MNEQTEPTEHDMLLADERNLKRDISELEAMLNQLKEDLKQVQFKLSL